MTNIAIRVSHLSKRDRIGTHRPDTLRDTLAHSAQRLSSFLRPRSLDSRLSTLDSPSHIWALHDLSFAVPRGQVLGIIGRNGAGKSTLLKILSRITEPTNGRVEIDGRVASLLEVGTGFHPELTGRENISLNGAILGMNRAEIARKFDEIVAFAEVEQFIDTPVKHYSSGMYLRLAFAVAAHLEPEILLVDEVLAVGDAEFQNKCLGKMGEVAKQGRTVLFVSHNMAAVAHLCQRAIVLSQGSLAFEGARVDAIAHYLAGPSSQPLTNTRRHDRRGSGAIRVSQVEVRDMRGQPARQVAAGDDIEIWLHFTTDALPRSQVLVGITFKTIQGTPVFLHHNRLSAELFDELPRRGAFVCRIPQLPLAPNRYLMSFSVMANRGLGEDYVDSVDDVAEVSVTEGDFYGTGEVPPSSHGHILVRASWRVAEPDLVESQISVP